MNKIRLIVLLSCFLTLPASGQRALVLQSDFGEQDGAVAAMRGVAFTVSADIRMFDLTHEIPAYNIWQAAYQLLQTAPYWPQGTVFVSVVDPGVGSDRKSVVLKSKSGHYFVTPDNGTLTLIAAELGIAAVREIDEAINRRKGSEQSYTFHGRDVYAYTGARLASGQISFAQVGALVQDDIVRFSYLKPARTAEKYTAQIMTLDPQYGNIWTNLPRKMLSAAVQAGDSLHIQIFKKAEMKLKMTLPLARTFADVEIGQPLLYFNSLDNLAIARNQGSFAEEHNVGAGPAWTIRVERLR